MGSLKRKFDLSTAETIMPRKYGKTYRRRYRRFKPYSRYNGLSTRIASKEFNPTHTFSWFGNAGSLSVTGVANRHGALSMNTSSLLANSNGFLKLRELYTLYRIKKILIKVIASDDDSLAYNFTATYQYNPLAIYPTLNDSDNQVEGPNSKTKYVTSSTPAIFKARFNTLSQTYSSLISSGYEIAPRNMNFYSSGGQQSTNITDVHCGRLLIGSPGVVLNASTAALRIVIEFTCQFAAPNWNA